MTGEVNAGASHHRYCQNSYPKVQGHAAGLSSDMPGQIMMAVRTLTHPRNGQQERLRHISGPHHAHHAVD